MADADQEDVVVLTDEEGHEHEFTVIDVIEVEGKEYAILVPMLETDEEVEDEDVFDADEAVILRIDKDDEGEDILVDIEDEEEWQRVANAWDELLDEEFEGGDEDEDLDEDEDEEEDNDEE